MSDGFNFQTLKREILLLSQSQIWEAAVLEWQLSNVYDADEHETCLCSHFPIREVCVIRNIKNNSITEVGNICVKKFLGLRSDKVFACLKRIGKDNTKALNAETIELFHQQNLITDFERDFSYNTMTRRSLSPKQSAIRLEIAKKIVNKTRKLKSV